MMDAEIVISIAVVTGLVLIINQITRLLRASIINRTIRDAISRDSPLTVELLDRIEKQQESGGGDDRNGLVLLALGAAVVGYGLLTGDEGELRAFIGTAFFPLFVGIALIARARRAARAEQRTA